MAAYLFFKSVHTIAQKPWLLRNMCPDRSMEVQLSALFKEIMTYRPFDSPTTSQPTDQPTRRRTWGFIGKCHFEKMHNAKEHSILVLDSVCSNSNDSSRMIWLASNINSKGSDDRSMGSETDRQTDRPTDQPDMRVHGDVSLPMRYIFMIMAELFLEAG